MFSAVWDYVGDDGACGNDNVGDWHEVDCLTIAAEGQLVLRVLVAQRCH
jgi:hypothetical protein